MERQKVWSVEDIKEVLRELDEKTGLDSSSMKVEISGKMTRCKGKCIWYDFGNRLKPFMFKFAKGLVNGSYEAEVVKKTIIHEYAHFLTVSKFNKGGHTSTFKFYDKFLGGDGETYFKYKPVWREEKTNTRKQTVDKTYKYNVVCSCCGKIVCKRNRLNKNLFNNYISNCCKAKLKAKEV